MSSFIELCNNIARIIFRGKLSIAVEERLTQFFLEARDRKYNSFASIAQYCRLPNAFTV